MLQSLFQQIFFIQLSATLANGICHFPDFTVFGHKWEAKISQERHTVGAYWIFNQTTVELMRLTKQQPSDIYSCAEEASNNFLIMLNLKDIKSEQSPSEDRANNEQMMIYRCMQLFKHSDNVLQLKLSPLSVFGPIELLCSGSEALWDSYILVWPTMTTYEACPLVGGYHFYLTDQDDNKLCANLYLTPVLESKCIEEESMSIDFRNFNCKGKLGMQVNQRLLCLGSWTEGNFTFSVVSSTDEIWPRLWLFRSPINMQHDNFNVQILSEITAVTTDTIETTSTDHYTMHLSRQIYASTCEDEAVACNECPDGNILAYCQKSCNACQANQMGNFSSNATGNWVLFSSSGTKNITISTSLMQIGDTLFTCINLETNKWYKTKDRQIMSLVFNNGCKPRYLCVDFVLRSNSVLQYRISQYIYWPQSLPMNADDMCKEDMFVEEKSKSPNYIPGTHKYRTVVTANGTRQKVLCGLVRVYFQLIAHFPDRGSCKMLMNFCRNNSQTSFDLIFSNECNTKHLTESEHECIAAFTDDANGDQIVITQGSRTRIAYCWVLHKEEWEPRARFFLTYASECNPDTVKYILYRNYSKYLAYFDIVAGSELLGSYSCSQDLKNQFLNTTDDIANIISTAKATTTPHFNSYATNQRPDEAPIHLSNHGIKDQEILINIFMLVILLSQCSLELLS